MFLKLCAAASLVVFVQPVAGIESHMPKALRDQAVVRRVPVSPLGEIRIGRARNNQLHESMIRNFIERDGDLGEHRADMAFDGAEHPSQRDLLQKQCQSFLTEAGSGAIGEKKGESGGQWSPCTHLTVYGINFAPFLGHFLAYQLAPKTALEFGCGLGTTSDFVARFADATVTCVEPEKTLGELIMSLRGGMRNSGALQQLAINVFSEVPEVHTCVKSGALKNDLVYSLEVAEHIPAKFHNRLVSTLVNATGKWLVFSAARPGQGGTGHIPESMLLREKWQAIFEAAGLIYMPKLSTLVRQSAYPQRQYDLAYNLNVFRNPSHDAEDTDVPHPKLAKFHQWWGHTEFCQTCKQYDIPNEPKYFFDGNSKERQSHLKHFYEGVETALWPNLMEKHNDIRSGQVRCQAKGGSSLVEGAAADEGRAFESAWGAHFYNM